MFVLTNGTEHPPHPACTLRPQTHWPEKKGLSEALMSAGDVIPASDISSNSAWRPPADERSAEVSWNFNLTSISSDFLTASNVSGRRMKSFFWWGRVGVWQCFQRHKKWWLTANFLKQHSCLERCFFFYPATFFFFFYPTGVSSVFI